MCERALGSIRSDAGRQRCWGKLLNQRVERGGRFRKHFAAEVKSDVIARKAHHGLVDEGERDTDLATYHRQPDDLEPTPGPVVLEVATGSTGMFRCATGNF